MDSAYPQRSGEDAQTELGLTSDANIGELSGISELPLEEQVVALEELHASLQADLDQAGAAEVGNGS
ncbi:MAG: hypothetical protein WAT65_11410 [Candidatus Nanopelagicales bacterium]